VNFYVRAPPNDILLVHLQCRFKVESIVFRGDLYQEFVVSWLGDGRHTVRIESEDLVLRIGSQPHAHGPFLEIQRSGKQRYDNFFYLKEDIVSRFVQKDKPRTAEESSSCIFLAHPCRSLPFSSSFRHY